MTHPRAAELTRLIRAVEAAGKPVSAVEVVWIEVEGKTVPKWVILSGGEEPKRVEGPIEW